MIIAVGDKKLEIVTSDIGLAARVLPGGLWHSISDKNVSFGGVKVTDADTVEITLHIKKIINISDMLITVGDIKDYD